MSPRWRRRLRLLAVSCLLLAPSLLPAAPGRRCTEARAVARAREVTDVFEVVPLAVLQEPTSSPSHRGWGHGFCARVGRPGFPCCFMGWARSALTDRRRELRNRGFQAAVVRRYRGEAQGVVRIYVPKGEAIAPAGRMLVFARREHGDVYQTDGGCDLWDLTRRKVPRALGPGRDVSEPVRDVLQAVERMRAASEEERARWRKQAEAYAEARAALDRAIEQNDEVEALFAYRALVHLAGRVEGGQCGAAIQEPLMDNLRRRVVVHQASGHDAQARWLLDRMREIDPADPFVQERLTTLDAVAWRLATQAQAVGPQDPAKARDLLAKAARIAGRNTPLERRILRMRAALDRGDSN